MDGYDPDHAPETRDFYQPPIKSSLGAFLESLSEGFGRCLPQELAKRSPEHSVRSCLNHSKEGKLSTLEGASKAGEALALASGQEAGMKRIMLLIASMMLALLLAAGVALAQNGVSKVCNTNCSGTDRDDQLTGTSNRNAIEGRDGADQIDGNGAKDTLNGNRGEDAIYGGNGEDKLYGGGNDDYMQGGIKSDYIDTGSGDDVVAAKDGFKDQIFCGSDFDRVYVDRIDVLHRCEMTLSEMPQPQL
jgi:preprotein translocase subunit SecG